MSWMTKPRQLGVSWLDIIVGRNGASDLTVRISSFHVRLVCYGVRISPMRPLDPSLREGGLHWIATRGTEDRGPRADSWSLFLYT